MNISLPHWIRYARKRANMRQSDVAEKLGILRSTIAHWETNRTTPNKDSLAKFEELVGEKFDGEMPDKVNNQFKTLTNQEIDSILILQKLQKIDTYEFVLLIQSFLKEKNA
jgi:transcriptional regulator with XRE-family HTH domain